MIPQYPLRKPDFAITEVICPAVSFERITEASRTDPFPLKHLHVRLGHLGVFTQESGDDAWIE